MLDIKKDNHFIPQMYLKGWATDKHVYVYKKIVEHHNVPLWKSHSLKGIGYIQYLYVNTKNGQENDVLESWFDKSFEFPAEKSLSKVISDKTLTQNDYINLINFLALQDLRTPKKYIEQLSKLNESDFTKILESVLCELEKKGIPKDLKENEVRFHEEIPLKVSMQKLDNTVSVQANILGGRAYWLWSIQTLLKNTAHHLHGHKWNIIHPARGLHWFTGDNPVVKLNLKSEKHYNLGGGWQSQGTYIFMPLSPQHLLFTCVGKEQLSEKVMSSKDTMLINKMIIENCHRYVISNTASEFIEQLHSRVVCPNTVKHERNEWIKWHKEQKEAEENFTSGHSHSGHL